MSAPLSRNDWERLRRAATEALPGVIEKVGLPNVLLPYQGRTVALLESTAVRVLFIEKSRRIGLTWGLAAYAVLRAGRERAAGGMDVMYISYSQEMTREFIDACAMWARAFSSALVAQDLHAAAFVIAGAQADAMLKDFFEVLEKALGEGTTLDEFRKDFDRIPSKYGWSYHGSAGWRSKLIFQVNTRMAYAAGRWEQIQRLRRTRPYLRYVHVDPELNQENSRPEHAAWHDTVLPVDDPW